MRSGKSRLLEVLEVILGPTRSISTSNISSASLFRLIDANPGVAVLVDEVDRISKEKADELWGLINSGWRFGGKAHRQGGAKMTELQTFSTFAPKVPAGIGQPLPGTVADRSIPIRMERKLPGETVERLRLRRAGAETADLRARLLRWATEDTIDRLRRTEPRFPAGLTNDRLMDVSEPLLVLADLAGDIWPERVRSALLGLEDAGEQVAEEEASLLALRHVYEVFTADDIDTVFTDDLLSAMCKRDDGPWSEWWGEKVEAGKMIAPARRLGKLIERFGTKSMTVRIGTATRKGYRLADVAPAAYRYLSVTSVTPGTPPGQQRYGSSRCDGWSGGGGLS